MKKALSAFLFYANQIAALTVGLYDLQPTSVSLLEGVCIKVRL